MKLTSAVGKGCLRVRDLDTRFGSPEEIMSQLWHKPIGVEKEIGQKATTQWKNTVEKHSGETQWRKGDSHQEACRLV